MTSVITKFIDKEDNYEKGTCYRPFAGNDTFCRSLRAEIRTGSNNSSACADSGAVRNIGREGESFEVMTLSQLRDYKADMFTTVFIGNSQTMNINGRMVTPRGYRDV